MEKTSLLDILSEYHDIPMRDIVLARVAGKLEAIEIMLVEKLCPSIEERKKFLESLDSDCTMMTRTYLNILRSGAERETGRSSGSEQN